MLKPTQSTNQDLPTAALADLNKEIFFDETITEEGYKDIVDKPEQYITTSELQYTIQHHFSANKSSGLS
jgi:hypothetical protein